MSHSSSSSSSSSSSMSSSWSDLPLDLLISIKNKLEIYQRSDLASFRSVCSQWRSAMPAPNPFPRYEVTLNKRDKTIHFTIDNDNNTSDNRPSISLPLPLSSSSNIFFFCSSNGWLIFISNDETLHLFDPVSKHKLILPPLTPKLLRHYNKIKSIVPNASRLYLTKVIVSSSAINGSVAVAGIVRITNRTKLVQDTRFVFCRYGDSRQRWNLLMERSQGIRDIALTSDGQFYAIGEGWELYMLDERPPLIRLKRLKLWLPKKILEPVCEVDPIDERLSITCWGLEGIDGSNLEIYGCYERYRSRGSWITLKLDVPKLCGRRNNINVVCEAQWSCFDPSPYYGTKVYFTPSQGKDYVNNHMIKRS